MGMGWPSIGRGLLGIRRFVAWVSTKLTSAARRGRRGSSGMRPRSAPAETRTISCPRNTRNNTRRLSGVRKRLSCLSFFVHDCAMLPTAGCGDPALHHISIPFASIRADSRAVRFGRLVAAVAVPGVSWAKWIGKILAGIRDSAALQFESRVEVGHFRRLSNVAAPRSLGN